MPSSKKQAGHGSGQLAHSLFSHKQKVALMKATKERRAARKAKAEEDERREQNPSEVVATDVVNDREGLSGKTVNPLRSRFDKEQRAALDRRKQQSQAPFQARAVGHCIAWDHFVDIDGHGQGAARPVAIAMPVRPCWDRGMDTDALEGAA